MIVLRAIGRFFARIGRWIRDTAWVQPLLIVGGIFAIIFSIPYITKWVQSWFESGNAAVEFYSQFKQELKGCEDKKSEADALMKYITADQDNAEYKAKFGTKFFIAFVQEDCATCETNYKGLTYAKSNWGEDEFATYPNGEAAKKTDFKLYTIFADELNSDDDNYFKKWFYDSYGGEFEDIAAIETPYRVKEGTDSTFTNLEDKDSFISPTMFLIDFSFEADNNNVGMYENLVYGVTEVISDIPGKNGESTNVAKARTVWDCWNHTGRFENKSNSK